MKEQFTMKQIIATLKMKLKLNSYKLGIFSSSRYIMDMPIKNPALALKVWRN